MARFKAPRITTAQRVGLLLEDSELVYDTDQKLLYTGNGVTLGGIPVGSGVGNTTEIITITNQNFLDEEITLSDTPLYPSKVRLVPEGGPEQFNGIDFQVTGDILSWAGKGLSGFLEAGDKILIIY
jgi:hypothetical protein